jgi:membrane fusion protein (multidrug efflux system)
MRDEAGGSDTGGPEPDDHGGAGTERQGSGPGEPASSNDCRKHRWRRWVLWIVLLIIIAFIAAWGIRKWIYGRHHESTNDAQISGHLVPVRNRVGAYVAEVYVHDGDHVAAGQLLVRLEETDLRPALLESEVAVAEGQARLQLSQTRITAPVTGVVANRSVEPGQLLEPGQPLMVVVADSGVYITANFKET